VVVEALQKNVIWHGRDVGICVHSEEGRLNKVNVIIILFTGHPIFVRAVRFCFV